MTVESLTALLGSAAAIITAVTAMVAAWRGNTTLKSHIAGCATTAAGTASQPTTTGKANG